MRKSPVKAITNFLPTDEVKNSDHFIECMFCLYRCAWADGYLITGATNMNQEP
jgi:hypothetical protein